MQALFAFLKSTTAGTESIVLGLFPGANLSGHSLEMGGNHVSLTLDAHYRTSRGCLGQGHYAR
jgi:hypothetical protein